MQFIFDKTGFPVLRLPNLHLETHLFPVMKMQFERFLADSGSLGDLAYEEMLAGNPRVSHLRATSENREGMILTGVLPSEALAFANWLGRGLDLPTVAEWRAMYGALSQMQWPVSPTLDPVIKRLSPACVQMMRQLPTDSMFDFSLMHGGVVEWVRDGGDYVGLGQPRDVFCAQLFAPMDEVVTPIRPGQRLPYFGFRLVKRDA